MIILVPGKPDAIYAVPQTFAALISRDFMD